MDIDLADLPDKVEALQRMVRTLGTERANLTEAQAEIERLRLIVQKQQRSQFGRRIERLDDDQLRSGFEDLHADIARVEATLPSTTVKMPRSRRDRAITSMTTAIPSHKFADAIFDGCRRTEIGIADKIIDVSIGCRDIAWLHRQQLLVGLSSQLLLKDRNDPHQLFRLVVADIVDAPWRGA
jgi:hypothetical protein